MFHIVVNESSGNRSGEKTLRQVEKFFQEKGAEFEVHRTNHRGHCAEIVQSLTSRGEKTDIIAVGGDGTFHEALSGIADFDNTTLGFIPSGRGNDFARTANIHSKPLKTAAAILRGETTFYDYIQIGDKRCLNVAGTGLDIEVLERVQRKKKSAGRLSYVFALLKTLRKFRPYKMRIEIDGEKLERDALLVSVANGGYIGGGIRISPYSELSDGKINVVVINMVKRRVIPFVFLGFLKGRHLKPKKKWFAEHYVCEEVNIVNESGVKYQLDGEIYQDMAFNAKVIKNGLKVFKPD